MNIYWNYLYKKELKNMVTKLCFLLINEGNMNGNLQFVIVCGLITYDFSDCMLVNTQDGMIVFPVFDRRNSRIIS